MKLKHVSEVFLLAKPCDEVRSPLGLSFSNTKMKAKIPPLSFLEKIKSESQMTLSLRNARENSLEWHF